MTRTAIMARVDAFCRRLSLKAPILLAPMAGIPAPALSLAVMNAGGFGGCGVLQMSPDEISKWCADVRAASRGGFQLNVWVPDPPPLRNADVEARVREFLAAWGPAVPANAAEMPERDFAAQCEAMLKARPAMVSSVMGLFPPAYVNALKANNIAWAAGVCTVADAKKAVAAGADIIVAQGSEAGGHRANINAAAAEQEMVGLMSLLPAIVDAVDAPVVATGGIADPRGVAAALLLGASAVQIGTGFLRSPEAGLNQSWADAIGRTPPEGTRVSRVFSGRAGRSIATAYVAAATADSAPTPAPHPIQRALTKTMRDAANRAGDLDRMQAWAGQSAAMARAEPAAKIFNDLWNGARTLLA